jgi:hypothetical protein
LFARSAAHCCGGADASVSGGEEVFFEVRCQVVAASADKRRCADLPCRVDPFAGAATSSSDKAFMVGGEAAGGAIFAKANRRSC